MRVGVCQCVCFVVGGRFQQVSGVRWKANFSIGVGRQRLSVDRSHKTKQKPSLNILILPLDNQEFEIPHKLPVSLTETGIITSTQELDRSIELMKSKYLKQIKYTIIIRNETVKPWVCCK